MIRESLEKELLNKEQLLQRADRKLYLKVIAEILADDFLEIGMSGTLYNKNQVLEHIGSESEVNIFLLLKTKVFVFFKDIFARCHSGI